MTTPTSKPVTSSPAVNGGVSSLQQDDRHYPNHSKRLETMSDAPEPVRCDEYNTISAPMFRGNRGFIPRLQPWAFASLPL
jgi:hypothetical protein